MAAIYLDADVPRSLGARLAVLGHDVLATAEVGRGRAHDDEQLAYAAGLKRMFVTHNTDDYLLLQRAWHHWADLCAVHPKPLHAGILAVPQPPKVSIARLAREIDAFVRSHAILANRFHEWTAARGWVQDG